MRKPIPDEAGPWPSPRAPGNTMPLFGTWPAPGALPLLSPKTPTLQRACAPPPLPPAMLMCQASSHEPWERSGW